MPKQIYKILQFHGGLNSNSDARDIADNELSEATDIMVDELGKIRLMGGIAAHVSGTPEDDVATGWTGTLIPGYGLFYFSHDRTGAENRSGFSGTHTAADSSTIMTDSAASFVTDNLIGGRIYNDTDGSSGLITDNDGTTVTVASLTGGSDNSWDDASNDAYHIGMPITGDDYLAIYDGNDGQVWIYSKVENTWDDVHGTDNTGVIDIGSSNTTTAQVNYYAVDGALRICDGLFTNSNTPQWYGYVHRSHFILAADSFSFHPVDASEAVHYSKWVSSDQQMSAPTRGLLAITGSVQQTHGAASGVDGSDPDTKLIDAGAWTNYTDTDFIDNDYVIVNETNNKYATVSERTDANTLTTTSIPGEWDTSDEWALFPAPGTGFNINALWSSSGGTWPNAIRYDFAASFVYDGNQETALYEYADTAVSTNTYTLSLTIKAIGNFDPRYTGFRIYYKETVKGRDWLFLAEVDLARGAKDAVAGNHRGWASVATNPASNGTTLIEYSTNVYIDDPPTAITYGAKSGIHEDDRISSIKYKTAVVANRRAYIGNVQYSKTTPISTLTRATTTIEEIRGDAVIKSGVNQFDTFGLNGLIEASVNDGDNIVKLEAYADRLLIFKETKMELVNISQEVEFLEDTFMHKGVSHPAATCKTDFGIAWVNKLGCYLYDGQKVNNLLEKGGRQIIKESLWETFTTNEPMIGYIPKKRQLLIANDVTTTGDGATFLYDIVTQSWVEGAAATITSEDKTNFITDWNGDLVYAHTAGTIVKWDDAADTSTAMVMSTKDIDFGNPGQKKTVYKVIVTYTTAASGSVDSNVQVDYGVNGDTTFAYDFTVPELPAANGWQTAELVPDVLSEASNIKSFRLRFATDGSVPAGFEINDISIVYRLKGTR